MENLTNKIVCGDCIEILAAAEKPFADLIFADPPFNIGYKYDKYHDKKKKDQYLSWTKDWITACYNVLKPNGSFYIAIGDDYAANVKIIAEEIGLICRNWIIWHYTFGQQMKTKFARAHTHIFYFVKDKDNFTFNDKAVRTLSDRQLIYKDKRANAAGKMPDDVWNDFSRVCGTFKERLGWHPCQMPEMLLARIIAASSKQGDCVLDPFMGSATTAAVAVTYGRKYAGVDISADYVKGAIERTAQAEKIVHKQQDSALGAMETAELKRLFVETQVPFETLNENDKLMDIFINHFRMRIGSDKKYELAEITNALKEFSIWIKRT
ncbi:MAG: site-specific DNA-methyltransferase [Anaerohalosphaeraceae bacterium]|nr:site-specific DNA-methyltransferase [Anaerohalosphaeraceae bacterium]